jgi:hypothetical protein
MKISSIFMAHGHEALPHTWMDEKRAYYPNLLSMIWAVKAGFNLGL